MLHMFLLYLLFYLLVYKFVSYQATSMFYLLKLQNHSCSFKTTRETDSRHFIFHYLKMNQTDEKAMQLPTTKFTACVTFTFCKVQFYCYITHKSNKASSIHMLTVYIRGICIWNRCLLKIHRQPECNQLSETLNSTFAIYLQSLNKLW